MSLFCHTESCRKRELTHLSQTPVWDLLFRGEACFQCPKYRPWKTIWELPQAPRSGWGCGSGPHHEGASSPCWGTGTRAHEMQRSELQTAATSSRVLVTSSAGTPRGQLQCIPNWHLAQNSLTLPAWDIEEIAGQKVWQSEGSAWSGFSPNPGSFCLISVASRLQICASQIHKSVKIIFPHNTAKLLRLFVQFRTTQGRQDL